MANISHNWLKLEKVTMKLTLKYGATDCTTDQRIENLQRHRCELNNVILCIIIKQILRSRSLHLISGVVCSGVSNHRIIYSVAYRAYLVPKLVNQTSKTWLLSSESPVKCNKTAQAQNTTTDLLSILNLKPHARPPSGFEEKKTHF